jgi:hypothetical protein
VFLRCLDFANMNLCYRCVLLNRLNITKAEFQMYWSQSVIVEIGDLTIERGKRRRDDFTVPADFERREG